MAEVTRQAVVPPTSAGPRLAGVVARQWGLVTRAQLLEAGLSGGGIAHWLATGRLHRMHRAVFAFTAAPLGLEARWMAAVLACGNGAVLSHYSAAAAWRLLRDDARRRVEVTIARAVGP